MDSQSQRALHYGQLDPVSDAQVFGTGHELLPSTLGKGARMVCEVLVLLSDLGLERGEFRLTGFPDFLSTHRITPQHIAEALIREHLGQLLIEEVHLKGPYAQQF